ncbi:glycosyltransferase [Nonomuraea sp. SBT364]|uniref:glycosyltransferase n=1 Tax=Nonomuraea sp. SBT364 TaxID=1580530 RepID=UPI00066C31F7|nr:glycosyltransferase [Nonomuraea sp. SBT364]
MTISAEETRPGTGPMSVCLIGKYPPIEGGVSAQTYWAARLLAERGHHVYVVTNADEVEERFRLGLGDEDAAAYEPRFPGGGFVRVFRPERFGRRMDHIPQGNPFVSKLAGLALQVVREFGCDVVVGSYLEPYGVAAHLVSGWTGLPLLVQHAGSDLDRLMRVPELGTAYQEVFRAAHTVITKPGLVGRFLGMGVARDAIRMSPPYAVPPCFHPDAVPLSAEEIGALAHSLPGAPPMPAYDPSLPTIGMYGKPGEFKGTLDLIAALGRVRASGRSFNLLLMSGRSRTAMLRDAVAAHGLEDRAWLLPFVPHWKVPRFIRACTATCFLERDFPVVIHGPVVPREVLASGTCLVLSGEIHDKQIYRDTLGDGDNFVLVPDPKEHDVLADRLQGLIDRPQTAAEIGARGRLVAADFPGPGPFAEAWEALLEDAAGRAPSAGRAVPPARGTFAEWVEGRLPWAREVLGDALDELTAGFTADHPGCGPAPDGAAGHADGHDLAVLDAYCEHLDKRYDGPALRQVRELVRYQRARLWALRAGETRPGPVLSPAPDALAGLPITAESVGPLHPLLRAEIRLEHFDGETVRRFCRTGDAYAAPGRGRVVVCFARLANLATTELRMNEATAMLLDACDGGVPTAALVERLARRGGVEPAELTPRLLATLAKLYRAGVLVFTRPPAPQD